jgi:uncharacterized membrane protein
MNPKLKAFLLGAAEAVAVGFVIGVGAVWIKPEDVLFTSAGVLLALQTGAQVAVIYLLGFLRKNMVFREVWTPERRAVEGVK